MAKKKQVPAQIDLQLGEQNYRVTFRVARFNVPGRGTHNVRDLIARDTDTLARLSAMQEGDGYTPAQVAAERKKLVLPVLIQEYLDTGSTSQLFMIEPLTNTADE